jgi:hypothetical protein
MDNMNSFLEVPLSEMEQISGGCLICEVVAILKHAILNTFGLA